MRHARPASAPPLHATLHQRRACISGERLTGRRKAIEALAVGVRRADAVAMVAATGGCAVAIAARSTVAVVQAWHVGARSGAGRAALRARRWRRPGTGPERHAAITDRRPERDPGLQH